MQMKPEKRFPEHCYPAGLWFLSWGILRSGDRVTIISCTPNPYGDKICSARHRNAACCTLGRF